MDVRPFEKQKPKGNQEHTFWELGNSYLYEEGNHTYIDNILDYDTHLIRPYVGYTIKKLHNPISILLNQTDDAIFQEEKCSTRNFKLLN